MAWKIDNEIEKDLVSFVEKADECWYADLMRQFNLSKCRIRTILMRHSLDKKPKNGMSPAYKQTWQQKVAAGTKRAYDEGRLTSPMLNKEVAAKAAKTYKKTFEKHGAEILKKRQESLAEHYGSLEEAYAQINAKTMKTYTENYGSVEKAYEHISDKVKETMLEKYGVDNIMKLEDVKAKAQASQIERYGALAFNTQKQKNTMMKKYGVDNNWKSKNDKINGLATRRRHYAEYIAKGHQTKLERYGDKNYNGHEHAIRPKGLTYKGKSFDSIPELAFYIYNIDNGRLVEREPIKLSFTASDGSERCCWPDFRVDGVLYELKGKQFLNEDGTWYNPYNKRDLYYEDKHQFLLSQGVKIISEFSEYVSYVDNKYGKDFFKECRNK